MDHDDSCNRNGHRNVLLFENGNQGAGREGSEVETIVDSRDPYFEDNTVVVVMLHIAIGMIGRMGDKM